MQLKTILNRVEPCRSFVYGKSRFVEGIDQVRRAEARQRSRPAVLLRVSLRSTLRSTAETHYPLPN